MLAMGLMLFAPLVSRVLVALSVMPTMTMAGDMAMPGMAQSHAHHAPDNCSHWPPPLVNTRRGIFTPSCSRLSWDSTRAV